MRRFELMAGLLVALIAFIIFKVIGLVIKFAFIAAVLGFIAGLVIARMLRSKAR